MTQLADSSLVVAAIDEQDALHARAMAHLRGQAPLMVPYSVGIELLLIAKRRFSSHRGALAATIRWFLLEREDVLFTAASALDDGDVTTVFDAVHLADAALRGAPLHTADAEMLRGPFPTVAF